MDALFLYKELNLEQGGRGGEGQSLLKHTLFENARTMSNTSHVILKF